MLVQQDTSLTRLFILTADKAVYGERINVYVVILNLTGGTVDETTIYGEPVMRVGGQVLEGLYRAIVPYIPGVVEPGWMMTEYGLCYRDAWVFSLVMPNHSMDITVEVWVEGGKYDMDWHMDQSLEVTVPLEVVPGITDFCISDFAKVSGGS